ncbi:MAG: hypothetical protein WC277_02060 [Bacilli bacterium]
MIGRIVHALFALATLIAVLLWTFGGGSGIAFMGILGGGALTFLTRGWAEQ